MPLLAFVVEMIEGIYLNGCEVAEQLTSHNGPKIHIYFCHILIWLARIVTVNEL